MQINDKEESNSLNYVKYFGDVSLLVYLMYNSLQITKIGMLLVGSAGEHQPRRDNWTGGQIMAGSSYPGCARPLETTQVSRGIQDGQGTDTLQGECLYIFYNVTRCKLSIVLKHKHFRNPISCCSECQPSTQLGNDKIDRLCVWGTSSFTQLFI